MQNHLLYLVMRWGMAVLYMAVLLAVLLVFPTWLWPYLLGAYAVFLVWTYWTLERAFALERELRPLTRWDVPDYDNFRARLRQACDEFGLRQEPVWAVETDDEPNAWALAGRRGIVGFTTGLLRLHPPEEIVAIVGHELKHIASRDNLPAVMGGVWLSQLGWMSAKIRETAYASQHWLAETLGLVFAFVLDLALLIASSLAEVLLAKRSRMEEHMADLAGARLTSGAVMIAALTRLEGWAAEHSPTKRDFPRWSPGWIMHRLHASHPPHAERVHFLSAALERGDLRA